MSKHHVLKTWPEFFAAVADGAKTFEARKDDRGFSIGDTLVLCEYEPDGDRFTGRTLLVEVTYLLRGPAFGVESGFVVMAVRRVEP